MTRRRTLSLIFVASFVLAVLVTSVDSQAATRPSQTVRFQRELNHLTRVVAAQQRQLDEMTWRLQGEANVLDDRVTNTEYFDTWIEPLRACINAGFQTFLGYEFDYEPSCLWGVFKTSWVASKPQVQVRPQAFRRPQ